MDITINFTNLYTTVARSLSIIAKRSVDDNGESTFKNITLGTREVDIISDYLRQAAIDVATELSAFITASTDTSVTITMPDNYNSSCRSHAMPIAYHMPCIHGSSSLRHGSLRSIVGIAHDKYRLLSFCYTKRNLPLQSHQVRSTSIPMLRQYLNLKKKKKTTITITHKTNG